MSRPLNRFFIINGAHVNLDQVESIDFNDDYHAVTIQFTSSHGRTFNFAQKDKYLMVKENLIKYLWPTDLLKERL